jgi:hypothetical protein
LPSTVTGAVVSVAGHDHPVAAVGSGAVGPDVAFDSFGTAQVLLLTTAHGLDYDARERLAHACIDTVHRVLGKQRVLVAGTKTGLLLRRTLNLLGVTDNAARDPLDAAALTLAVDTAGITVAGANNDDGALRITIDTDTASPAALMARRPGPREPGGQLIAGHHGRRSRPLHPHRHRRRPDQDGSVRQAKQDALPDVRFAGRG